MALPDTSRPLHLHPGEGRRMRVITDLWTVKATARHTGEAYSLFEVETPPSGGSPPHTHRYEDDTFYITEGRYAFLIGEEEIELGAGAVAFVPRGTMCGYVNPDPTPARMLVFVTPGGIQEQFFEEVGDRADRPAWAPDMSRILSVAPKYGIEFSVPMGQGEV